MVKRKRQVLLLFPPELKDSPLGERDGRSGVALHFVIPGPPVAELLHGRQPRETHSHRLLHHDPGDVLQEVWLRLAAAVGIIVRAGRQQLLVVQGCNEWGTLTTLLHTQWFSFSINISFMYRSDSLYILQFPVDF